MSINIATIIKISLNKKDRVIASEIVNRRERRLLNERFKTIQKARRKREKKRINCLL
jgi:hypothetical protein